MSTIDSVFPVRKSGQPHRQLSPRAARTRLRAVLREMKRWSERLKMDVMANVKDEDVLFAIAFILDAISDEEGCGRIELVMLNGVSKLKLHRLVLDNDLDAALVERCGREKVTEAVDWLRNWMANTRNRDKGLPLYWLGWRLGHLKVRDLENKERLWIEIDNVVIDLSEGRTLGITLWDGPTLFKSKIVTLPSWKET